MRKLITSLLLASTVSLVACTSNPYTGERQASKASVGAGIGAASGAVIGLISGDNGRERTRNALIGAGVGGLAGGGVGYYMDQQEMKLRQQLESTGVSVTRNGNEIILNMPSNVTFPTDQSSIRPESYNVLNSVVLVLKEYDKTNIRITGHTDSDGSFEHNQQLSNARAQAVSSYFTAQGVNPGRISASGLGETQPIASNSTDAGKAQNRRVEIHIAQQQ